MSKSKNRKYSLSFEKERRIKDLTNFFKYQIININKNLILYILLYFLLDCVYKKWIVLFLENNKN